MDPKEAARMLKNNLPRNLEFTIFFSLACNTQEVKSYKLKIEISLTASYSFLIKYTIELKE